MPADGPRPYVSQTTAHSENRGALAMSIDRAILAFAGAMILVSLGLSLVHHPGWLWLTAFVGANLLQSAFTGFCPMATFLKHLGLHPGEAFH
jgi:hypothetical protein